MKTDRPIFSCRFFAMMLCASLLVAGAAQADEMAGDGEAMHYVIKVTPTLAYIDVGQAAGATIGAEYTVLQADDGEEMMLVIGEVRVLRVYAGFSIAEITSVEPGQELAILHRVIPRAEAVSMDILSGGDGAESVEDGRPSGGRMNRSLVFMGGIDLSKSTDLTWGTNRLMKAGEVSGPAIAIRLGRMLTEKLRLALTYRLSGEPLGPSDAEVTQLSAELDAHLLLRGVGKPGPYIGFGGSVHLLSWDAPSGTGDSTVKSGFNVLGGLEIPIANGRWSLFAEGGYQGVTQWASMLDASHVRAYVGLGRNF
ncbi:MAG: hypothetical protein HN712_02355 [Gemmatimonadetes bacterium]|nr:hypothetical protein [Gemmatimonadota bacterium]MBT6147267.1 hypothetical protein [Gemmatimonadota bacterium]MBT7859118.1 hypothetical protein [Gemmatimonadota bacterium]